MHRIERINREIRRRTNAVGCFPDGNNALMLVCAKLRFVSASEWGVKSYLIFTFEVFTQMCEKLLT